MHSGQLIQSVLFFYFLVLLSLYKLSFFFQKYVKVIHTDFPCPMCGETRAYQYISKGDIINALRMNFFVVFYLFYIGFIIILFIFLNLLKNIFENMLF